MNNEQQPLLQVGEEIIFTDVNGNLVKGKITKVRTGDKNELIGCELETADGTLIYLPIVEEREIYKEISFSRIEIGMKIIFSNSENKLLKGEVAKHTLGEGNKIIGCDAITLDKKEFELSKNEDKVFALFSNKQQTPLQIEGITESLYAGFWTRLGSLLLDFIFLLPFTFLILYFNSYEKNIYFFTLIPAYAFNLWYNIYLPKKYGGTPGKLTVGIKIIRIDGKPIDWREAILRYSVLLVLNIFVTIMTISNILDADDATFTSLSWLKQSLYLFSFSPVLFKFYNWTTNIWVYGELIVLLTNKRKRAVHDFMAETVIVKAKYLVKIREAMNPNTTMLEAEGNKEH